jgi:hypothetical protein
MSSEKMSHVSWKHSPLDHLGGWLLNMIIGYLVSYRAVITKRIIWDRKLYFIKSKIFHGFDIAV